MKSKVRSTENYLFDNFIVAICLVVSGLSIFVINNSELLLFGLQIPTAEKSLLGHVIYAGRGVQKKSEKMSFWQSVGESSTVFDRDSLVTDEMSHAQVMLIGEDNKQVFFGLEPSSYVTFSKEMSQLNLSLEFGSIQGDMKSRAEIFLERAKNFRLRSDGHTTFNVRRSNTKYLVEVKSGKLTAITSSGKTEVQRGQQAAIEIRRIPAGESEIVDIELRGPPSVEPNNTQVKVEAKEEYKLGPDMLYPMKPEPAQPSADVVPTSTKVKTTKAPRTLPTPKEKKSALREQASVPKAKPTPSKPNIEYVNLKPALEYPSNFLQIDCSSCAGQELKFDWREVNWASTYIFEISPDQEFKKGRLRRVNVGSNSLVRAFKLEYGVQYFWRVKAVAKYKRSKWSDPNVFIIKKSE